MKFYTSDREAGNRIEEFETFEEAREAIERYYAEDKANGCFVPDFYAIEDEDYMTLYSDWYIDPDYMYKYHEVSFDEAEAIKKQGIKFEATKTSSPTKPFIIKIHTHLQKKSDCKLQPLYLMLLFVAFS